LKPNAFGHKVNETPVRQGCVIMNQRHRHQLLGNPRKLMGQIESRLDRDGIAEVWARADDHHIRGSAVLFLLTQQCVAPGRKPELCLLLTKRSDRVMQPGDLCCPGGGIAPGDRILSGFMPLPLIPWRKWVQWLRWRVRHGAAGRRVMQVWTAGLRESWEEMHLNPFKVSLIGPLPVQQLILFRRLIFPLVAWVPACPRLRPNREVARIVCVPLRCLLDTGNFGRLRLTVKSGQTEIGRRDEFPCFIHHGRQGTEILWGATFRITMDFLNIAFDFALPAMDKLPVVQGRRDAAYFSGSLWDSQTSRNSEH
jgi:hypothetical protein